MPGTPVSSRAASSALTQLFNSVLSGAQASFDITGIDQNYNHLLLIVNARSDNAVANTVLFLRFNGDATAIYDQEALNPTNVTVTAAGQVAITGIQLGNMPGSTAAANKPGSTHILIPSYTGTAFHKTALVANGWNESTAVGTQNWKGGFGLWRNTAAVTQVTLLPGVGNFIAGSQCSLYGVL